MFGSSPPPAPGTYLVPVLQPSQVTGTAAGSQLLALLTGRVLALVLFPLLLLFLLLLMPVLYQQHLWSDQDF